MRPEITVERLNVFWTDDRGALVDLPGSDSGLSVQRTSSNAKVLIGLANGTLAQGGVRITPGNGHGMRMIARDPTVASRLVTLRSFNTERRNGLLPANQGFVSQAVMEGIWRLELPYAVASAGFVGPFPEISGALSAVSYSDTTESGQVHFARSGRLRFQGSFNGSDQAPPRQPIYAIETPIGAVTIQVAFSDAPNVSGQPQAAQNGTRHQDGGPEAMQADSQNQEASPFYPRPGDPIQILYRWGAMPAGAPDNVQTATPERPHCDWIEINAAMVELDTGLDHADFSRLTFDPSELRLIYTPNWPSQSSTGSIIRLGAPARAQSALIDLSRARLRAARNSTLVQLQFTFADLMLSFVDGEVPEIVAANAACFVPVSASNAPPRPDPRPVLVVEFPPQHLLEEALFLPELAPLPDVELPRADGAASGPALYRYDADANTLEPVADTSETGDHIFYFDPNDRARIAEILKTLVGNEERKFREVFRNKKIEAAADDLGFQNFSICFFNRSQDLLNRNALPEPQRYYIGPVGLDIDAMHLARQIHGEARETHADQLRSQLFQSVRTAHSQIIQDFRDEAPSFQRDLRIEQALEAAVPSYQLYRATYRNSMIHAATGGSNGRALGFDGIEDLSPEHIEFIFHENDASIPVWAATAGITTQLRRRRRDVVDKAFVNAVLAPNSDSVLNNGTRNGLLDGRLSNPTRLAFRVPCRDGIQAARLMVAGLDTPPDFASELPRDRLEFSLNALTNFAAFELSVIRRAELVYHEDALGRRTGLTRRLDLSARGRLNHLGFQSGPFLTSFTRLADIQASLASPPGPFETAIEIPSRLILSPHQRAVFLTPHSVEPAIFDLPSAGVETDHRLWSANLFTGGEDPGLRAVHSPDLRPDFVWQRLHRRAGAGSGFGISQNLPGGGAPPRGPLAPWFLDRGETGSAAPRPIELALAERDLWPRDSADRPALDAILRPGEDQSDAAFCAELINEQQTTPGRLPLPAIISQLCRRVLRRRDLAEQNARFVFRSSLDAFARHELVLASSCWGLPSLGRRDLSGALLAESSQIEATPDDTLIDVRAGSALYKPRALSVNELSLTSIGGNFRHDTAFEPPASVQALDGTPLFDALSIERWQHSTVLGRDTYAEVVFKGFLAPFGHRASLVQVTERVFLTDQTGAVWAPLRQRMFIRIGRPEKRFPAIGQPFDGRAFPLESVTYLTTKSPDIIDPNDPSTGGAIDASGTLASGRLALGDDFRGLAFWPRTAPMRAANVRFEVAFADFKADIPVLFIDNVAANDRRSLELIVNYYNGQLAPDSVNTTAPQSAQITQNAFVPTEHLRTIAMGGRKYRYAPELKSGSASQETQLWTLRLSGRRLGGPPTMPAAPQGSHLGAVMIEAKDFDWSPALNGADQPPFYPEVDVARIRVRQAERLTGQSLPEVRARFDGAYLIHGLPPDPAQADTHPSQPFNTSEVYLGLLDMPALTMGAKGDRAGGLMRPDGVVGALSRKKGALTFAARRTLSSPTSEKRPLYGHAFSFDRLPVRAENTISAAEAAPNAARIAENETTEKIRNIYRDLFSPDAQLLGLIKLQDLMTFLDKSNLEDPDKGMPEMVETVRYQAAALMEQQQQLGESITNGVSDAVALVRNNVVLPLKQGVDEIRVRLDALEQSVTDAQATLTGAVIPNISLSKALPEFDQSLRGLSAAIDASLAETDPILFSLSLGGIYEAGHRFINAAAAAASSTLQGLTATLRAEFFEILDTYSTLDGAITDIIRRLWGIDLGAPEFRAQIAARIANWFFPASNALSTGDLLPMPVVGFEALPPGFEFNEADLSALERLRAVFRLPNGAARRLTEALIVYALTPQTAARDPSGVGRQNVVAQIREAARGFLRHGAMPNPQPPPETLSPAEWLARSIAERRTELDRAIEAVENAAQAHAENEVAAWLDHIKVNAERFFARYTRALQVLEDAARAAALETGEVAEKILDDAWDTVINAAFDVIFDDCFGRILETTAALATLYAEVTADDTSIGRIAQAALTFIEDLGGSVDFGVADVCDTINAPIEALDRVFAQFDLNGLALACPTRANVHVLVFAGRIRDEDAPKTADGTSPGRYVFDANRAISEILDPQEIEKILGGIDRIDDLPNTPVTQSVKRQLRTTVNNLQTQLAYLGPITANLYAALVNDSQALQAVQARLALLGNTELCNLQPNAGNAQNGLDTLYSEAIRTIPEDFEAMLRRRDALMHAALDSARKIGDIAKALVTDPILVAGGFAAYLTSQNMPSSTKLTAWKQDARAWEEKLRGIDHSVATSTVTLAIQILTYVDSYFDKANETLTAWESSTVFARISQVVDTRDLRAKLRLLRQTQTLFSGITAGNGTLEHKGLLQFLQDQLGIWGSRPSQERASLRCMSFLADLQNAMTPPANAESPRDLRKIVLDIQVAWAASANAPEFGLLTEILNKDTALTGPEVADLAFKATALLLDASAIPGQLEQELENRLASVDSQFARIKGFVRKELRQAESIVLGELDGVVTNLLTTQLGLPGDVNWTLAQFYEELLLAQRNALLDRLQSTFLEPLSRRVLLVAPEPGRKPPGQSLDHPSDAQPTPLTGRNDRLAADAAWLAAISAQTGPNGIAPVSDRRGRAFLVSFVRDWFDGSSTPHLIVAEAEDLIGAILSGNFLAAIPFDEIRDMVEEYLLALIPAEITMKYSHAIKLSKSVEDATLGIFSPVEGSELKVGAQITLKLNPSDLSPTIEFASTGEIGPFSVKLVGDLIDAVELKFAGATFSSGSNGGPEFDAEFIDAKIGNDLEFVQKFQKYLSPKPGSGVFIRPNFSPLGIEAGYGLSLGIISIGAMSIYNVSLNASVILPFENAPALFKASLSSRLSPFTISFLPYGGSGFFSITANPKGIVGFEASLEFGGAAAFGFGPLEGTGRLMVGVYIRQTRINGNTLTEISGTFFAGGSASLWIFSFGASLYVRLGMVGGNMSGEATFTFSFSMGIRDFEFSVRVWKTQQKDYDGDREQSSLLDSNRIRRFASIGDPQGIRRSLTPMEPQLRSFGRCKGENWQIYKSYLAPKEPSPIDGIFNL